MNFNKILNEERLNEMAYSIAIMNLLSYTELLNRKDVDHNIEFMKAEWPKTKENYGVETLKELIEFELSLPRPKKMYQTLSDEDKEKFWRKVDYIFTLI